MTTEEIEKASEEFCVKRKLDSRGYPPKVWFKAGAEFVNNHWQEKTRWKSLEKEPPTTFGERIQILLNNKHGELSLAPVYSDRSIEDYIDCGFIEWKEIE